MSQADSDLENFDLEAGLESNDLPQEDFQPIKPVAPVYRKQGFSIYSLFLLMSLFMLIGAIILFFVEVNRFQ